jgi:hypothetical protein
MFLPRLGAQLQTTRCLREGFSNCVVAQATSNQVLEMLQKHAL